MSAVVGEIVIDVTADVGPLMRQMNKAEGAMGGLHGAASRMGSGLSRAGGMAATFGRNVGIIAGTIATLTGAALVFVRSSAAFGDAIGDASKAAGMSTTAFQEYRFALKEAADMTDEDFASAVSKLNKTLGEARSGSASAVAAFEAIGVSQAQLADGAFTTDQALASFVAKMEATKDPALAAAMATELFGKAGADLGAGLSGVPGQVGALVDRARELGVVLGPEAVAAASQFDQKMNELTASFEVLKMKLANDLMPVLVNNVLPAIEDYVIPALETLGGAIAGAAELIVLFAEGTARAFEGFKTAVGGAIDWVTNKFETFMTLLEGVAQKVKDIVQSIRDAIPDISIGLGGTTYEDPKAAGGGKARPTARTSSSTSTGAAIADGMVDGLTLRMTERLPEVAAAAQMVTDTARATLGIQSPSTVFAEIGAFIGQGLANGIASTNGIVATAVSAMGTGAVGATDAMVNDVLGGLDTLLAGSQKGGAALALVNTMIGASQEIKKGTFGFASASKVIAQGMGFIKTIKGAKGGGRGGVASSGGAGSAAAAAPQQAVQDLGITFVNDPFGIGERTARAIATRVNEAQRNGVRLNVSVGA